MVSRLLAATALAVGVLLAATRGVSSQGPDALAVVREYIAAVNARNVTAVVALFADDAVHEVVLPVPGATGLSIGTGQIRLFYQQSAAQHAHLVLLGSPHVTTGASGDKVTFTVRMSSDGVRALALTTVDLFVVAIVAHSDQGSRFTSYTAALNAPSLQLVERARATVGVKEVRVFPLADAPAVDLPQWPATYQAVHVIYPAGYTSKHVHGGPSYIYVISGVLQIIDDKGTRTYPAGTFDFEPPAHVHTFHVIQAGTEIFSLRFLPPGATATIPVK
jgi:hypothetical protein